MNFKYFLRGLGVGVIFGALIMLAAYMSSGGYKMSDEEIIEKAKKLGMVEKESSIIVDDSTKDSTTEDTTESTTEKIVPDDTTEGTTEGETTEDTTQEDAEDVKTEDSTSNSITISVKSGMGSYEVSTLLKDAGIIDDASDFDVYLNENGYSTKIEVGEYKFTDDMTYEEIANMLIEGAE